MQDNSQDIIPSLTYIYEFKEPFDKVYNFFVSPHLLFSKAFSKCITEFNIEKAKKLDENGAECYFLWKNYYYLSIEVISGKNDKEYLKSYIHRTKNISRLENASFQIVHTFIWNSCENKTKVILDIEFTNSFIKDLFSDEFSKEEMKAIENNIESCLSECDNNLVLKDSCVIFKDIDKVWNIINKIENIFFDTNSNYCFQNTNSEPLSLNSKKYIIDKNNNELFACIKIVKLNLLKNYKNITFESEIKDSNISHNVLLEQIIDVEVKYISNSASFVSIQHISKQHITPEKYFELQFINKKILSNIKNQIEAQV